MNDTGTAGLIVAHYGVAVGVRTPDGNIRKVRIKRRSGHVVGDNVLLLDNELERLDRSTVLRRMDQQGSVRIVAANLDVLGIVVAPLPLSPNTFIDRAIVTARATGLTPFLVLNKADLEGVESLESEYGSLYGTMIRIFKVSAVAETGLTELRSYFSDGHRGAFVGTTGVGKSSLMNVLHPTLNLEVGEINEASGLGRHTTTVSTLHTLPTGGELIDTPGFRDFGLAEIEAAELGSWFPGFEEAIEEPCRFRNCLHRKEPGCKVTAAVNDGSITAARHASYLQILAELEQHEAKVPRRKG
jgi:ribosome biogenesis GTPase